MLQSREHIIMGAWWYVYILKSLVRDFVYIGSTDDLERRLDEHNKGLVQSTRPYAPPRIVAFVAVKTEKQARDLEKYFKTGSGKAVLKKRILAGESRPAAHNRSL